MARQKRNLTRQQLANLRNVKDGIPKEPVPKDETEKKRRDWERNHEIITSLYTELLLKKGKPPTITAIAKATKLSWKAVSEHLENYDFEQIKMRFRMGNEAVYMNLFKQAATSRNPKWAELFLKWTGDIQHKLDVTSGGKPLQPPAPPQIIIGAVPEAFPTSEDEVDGGK